MASKSGSLIRIWRKNIQIIVAGPILLLLGTAAPACPDSYCNRENLFFLLLGLVMLLYGSFFAREAPDRKNLFYAGAIPLLFFSLGLTLFALKPAVNAVVSWDNKVFFENPDPPKSLLFLIDLVLNLLFGGFGYWVGIIGRSIGKRHWSAIGAALALFIVLPPLLSGIAVGGILLVYEITDFPGYAYTPLFYFLGFLPAIPLLFIWQSRLAGRPASRRWIFTGIGAMAALGLVCHGAVFLVGYHRGKNALTAAREAGCDPFFREPDGQNGLAAVWQADQGLKQYLIGLNNIEIPCESTKYWMSTAGSFPVSEEAKQATIEAVRSPEMAAFIAAVGEFRNFDYIRYDSILENNHDQFRWRDMIRKICGVASVYHYLGETDKILPVLKAGLELSRLHSRMTPTIMNDLVHMGIDGMLALNVVSLGPDGPEYAGVYRQFLQHFQKTDYAASDDLTFFAVFLREALEKPAELVDPFTGKPASLLQVPFIWSYQMREVRRFIGLQPELAAWRRAAKIGEETDKDEIRNSMRSFVRRGKLARMLNVSSLALKLYRSQHGVYPETLAELAPEILPELPPDPFSGIAPEYRREEDSFVLNWNLTKEYPDRFSGRPRY